MTLRRSSVVASCAAMAAAALAGPAPAAAAELRAVADTGVDATRPHRAAGAMRVLRLSASPLRRGFVRFDLRGVTGSIGTATLHVYGRGRVTVRPVVDGARWSERRTTFASAPRVARPIVRSARLRGRWGRIDVTELVSLGERANLALGGSPRARVRSRESSRPPTLVVTTRTTVFTPAPIAFTPAPIAVPAPPTPVAAPTTLTVVQDVEPDAAHAIRYVVGTEAFTLTGDSRRRVLLQPGRHSVAQEESIGWPATDIACAGATQADVDVSGRTADLVIGPGESVECRFRNERHDPVVAAAGDIACKSGNSCGHRLTSDLLVGRPELTRVLPLGDLQYETGQLSEFMAPGAYHDTWGRLRRITRPASGNHEYETPGAAGYFDYFNGAGEPSGPAGDRATGYYSFDLGAWHLVALNSNLPAGAGSEQERWLRADLAAHPSSCTLAYWHHPRWTSGMEHGPATRTQALWQALHDAGADVVLSGHNHQYERFARQDAAGALDGRRGIRQFVVGTGGAGLYSFGAPLPNSQVRHDGSWGVLTLTLRAGSYDWRFEPTGGSFADAGSTACEGTTPRYAFRGVFSREADGSFAPIARLGFNLIDSVPGTIADLPDDLRALVWVGDYDDATCSFAMSDAELEARVQEHAADPRTAVWFISDEPSPDCPGVYAQHAARTELIKSLDPDARVLVVIDSNSAEATLEQIPHWRGATDHIGLNPYTCWQGQPCRYEWIDRVAQEADAAGLDYWGVVQAFGEPDGEGFTMCSTTSGCGRPRLPTASEIHQQFVHWRATRMSGYLVFDWRWPDRAPGLWLAAQPELQGQLADENAWP